MRPADMVDRVQDALKMDLYRLVRRLQAALELDASDPQPWQDLLLVLARQTAEGFRTPESRLLYDLQKVCVDHEREIYTVDVVEWAISLGRRPVKRPLPHQRDVLMLRHLRSSCATAGSGAPDRESARAFGRSDPRCDRTGREPLAGAVAADFDRHVG